MTEIQRVVILFVAGSVAAFMLVLALLSATARGEEAVPPSGPVLEEPFYVTATLADKEGHVIDRYRYNPSGSFPTEKACYEWFAHTTADQTFITAAIQLYQSAKETFGPDTKVTFSCMTVKEAMDKEKPV